MNLSSWRNLRGVVLVAALTISACTQQGSEDSIGQDWPMYRGNLAGTGYSALQEINPDNVSQLSTVWTYSLRSPVNDALEPNSQATPIVVNGVMYLPAIDRVVALDPQTGSVEPICVVLGFLGGQSR